MTEEHTVDSYLATLPDDRRQALEVVRVVILKNLPDGFKEVMQNTMISYVIPLDRFANTHNGRELGAVSLTSQKNYLSLYLMSIYSDPEGEEWLRSRWAKTDKKLDLGKSCVRFLSADDLALDVIGELVQRTSADTYISNYERGLKFRKSNPAKASSRS